MSDSKPAFSPFKSDRVLNFSPSPLARYPANVRTRYLLLVPWRLIISRACAHGDREIIRRAEKKFPLLGTASPCSQAVEDVF